MADGGNDHRMFRLGNAFERGWIEGRRPSPVQIRDDATPASDLAGFLVGLRSADMAGTPGAGLHSAFRAGPLQHWDLEMRDLHLPVLL